MDSAYFSGRSGGWKKFFQKFFLYSKFGCTLPPCSVAGKPFVLEDLYLVMGTSVACAVTAETIFEIVKYISDVDMPARGRMGSKCEIFRFFSILATSTIEIFRFVDVGHSFEQETC